MLRYKFGSVYIHQDALLVQCESVLQMFGANKMPPS